MRFQIVTLFPELLQAFADAALIAKAKESGVLRIETITPREFATDVAPAFTSMKPATSRPLRLPCSIALATTRARVSASMSCR